MPKSAMAGRFRMRSRQVLGGINQCLYVSVGDPDPHYARAIGPES